MLLGCVDLWGAHVSKKAPITASLKLNYGKGDTGVFYDANDLASFIDSTEVGQQYTMTLRVSSTCFVKHYVGFRGTIQSGCDYYDRCIYKYAVDIPPNSNNITITKTYELTDWSWGPKSEIEFTNRYQKGYQKCSSGTITIHDFTIVKGEYNCLEDRKYINKHHNYMKPISKITFLGLITYFCIFRCRIYTGR